MIVFGLDPGSVDSAWIQVDANTREVLDYDKAENEVVLERVSSAWVLADAVVVEMPASYGYAVSDDVFLTTFWAGRFFEAAARCSNREWITRRQVCVHLLGNVAGSSKSSKTKDSQIRSHILGLYGGEEAALGTKKQPGPLFGITGDVWAAFAVVIAHEKQRNQSSSRF